MGQFLLTLYQGSKERPVQSFRQWALSQLAHIVPFDWVCWRHGIIAPNVCQLHTAVYYRTTRLHGVLLEPADQPPPHSSATGSGQSLNMVTAVCPMNHNSASPSDSMIIQNIDKSGTLTANGEEPIAYAVICLYRNDPGAAFTKQEEKDATLLGSHLVESWIIKLFLHLQSVHQNVLGSIGESALCDAQGTLWCTRPQIADLLREEWPQWHGHVLPDVLGKTIRSGGNAVYDGKYIRCTISPGPTSDFFHMHVQKQPPLLSLPPRQRRIAIELAQGKTYNQIAHSLGISRSTVTNHANAIYSKLGISNKVQLAIICFGHSLQSLIM